MSIWLRHHRFALQSALTHLGKSPLGFLFNVIVIAIALALPFVGLTLLENVRPMSEQLAVEPEITLFMEHDLSRKDALALAAELRRILGDNKKSATISFIPREQALDQLRKKSGLSDVLTSLGENPLPDGYLLKLEGFNSAADAERVDAMAQQLQVLPGVETVQVDSAWVKRLAALLALLRLILLFLAATLAMVVIAVVFNTIRLQVLTQLDEIEVAKLVGATDAFVHRPFYYTGVFLGLCAGALALAAVALALHPLNAAIAEFARLYASQFQLLPLGLATSGALLAASALLGLIGAMLSVRRHLARLGT
jgi:cell division transport system permease protein